MNRPRQSMLSNWKRRLKGIMKPGFVVLIALFLSYEIFIGESRTRSAIAEQQSSTLSETNYHKAAAVTISRLVSRFHYRDKPLTNEFSEVILEKYLESLDPQKSYFLASDINQFRSNRFYYDDYLVNGDLSQVFTIFRLYQQRVEERTQYAKSILDFSFDFGLDEEYEIDRSNSNWISSQEEYDQLWRRVVKDDILTMKLSDVAPEEIKENLATRYDFFLQSVAKYNADDVTEIFLNSYLRQIEPHSEFFSPHSSENLKISLSQQIEGIGAMLRSEQEHTIVHSVITGGPAARSKKLNSGDKIVGVKNYDENSYTDIIGWRIGDVVDKIRGPKGTKVHLKIIPNDALPGSSAEEVSIIREKVKLEDQIARKSTVEIASNGKILQLGIIRLPAFYSDLYEKNSVENERSSSNDVRRLLRELREQEVDGLVMDLRGNGGGALQEAVNLTSLFIESGPIVQVETADGKVDLRSDSDGIIEFDGPLVVLIDRASASASEIFAAAIQDYKRGIVVGETSFGKGVVQTIWPLSRWLKKDNSGTVKLSTAQFYRIKGTSTQHTGVIPDVLFPTNQFVADMGERSFENAIPAGVISPAKSIHTWHNGSFISNRLPEIRRLNNERAQFNPVLHYLVENERLRLSRAKQKVVPLNEEKRQQALENVRIEQLENLNELRTALGLDATDKLTDEAYPSEQAGDVYRDEALNILSDLISIDVDSIQSVTLSTQ